MVSFSSMKDNIKYAKSHQQLSFANTAKHCVYVYSNGVMTRVKYLFESYSRYNQPNRLFTLVIKAGIKKPCRVSIVICRVDRKSTRLNSSHANISYAVFCLKKKKTNNIQLRKNIHTDYHPFHLPTSS